jgi:hypothetical protein
MSQRHRPTEAPAPPRQEVRAQAHGERHRINTELHQIANLVSSGLDPADVHEPGAAWRPSNHRSAAAARRKQQRSSRQLRHWKTKMWKRRTNLRRQRAMAYRLLSERP